MTLPPADFVLALHSHLPYVLNHGRWPHGSDWLCEAALDTYLPLLEVLRALGAEGVAAPVTLGVTPVLANQLASPVFAEEMEAFLTQRLAACEQAPDSLAATGEEGLLPLVSFWRTRLLRMRRLYHEIGRDLVGAYRALEAAGRIELMGSAATHAFLPLLARDESIRLQLAVGTSEHRRLFGRAPAGCWLPECAYRPRGPWHPWPSAPRVPLRRGIEEHLADAGYRYFFADSHLASAGRPLGIYGDPGGDPTIRGPLEHGGTGGARRSPYQSYRLGQGRAGAMSVLVRDPRTSMQVWSRYEGYPGDGAYLEFHKMRWPGGLKLWRVTDPRADLGAKAPYDPAAAGSRAREHAEHFSGLVEQLAAGEMKNRGAVIVAPFDTELFGHWWFEGPDFLGATYRRLSTRRETVRPSTTASHLDRNPSRLAVRLPAGSWGANGDFGTWLGPETAWTWERLWQLEASFWDIAPAAMMSPGSRPVLAQAAREMLLAQSSDWQFIISTVAAADYAERRFREHCGAAEALVTALGGGSEEGVTAARSRAEELGRSNGVFPDILPAVAAALGGSRALGI